MATTTLDSFDFFEHEDRGATAAQLSFVKGIRDVSGNFRSANLLKRDAAYRRSSSHSEIFDFRFVPITAYELGNKTVDLAKLEKDVIDNGRQAEDIAKYLSLITQVKTRRYSIQMYPKSAIIESEPVSKTEALLVGGGDAESGLVARMGSRDFSEAALNSETNENNNRFLDALRKTTITLKKRRWDGGVSDEDQDETVNLPEYCKYTCANSYLTINDFGRIRAQMQNNLTDTPQLVRPFKILVSPDQYENIIENNEKLQNTDFVRTSGLIETGNIAKIRGFTIEAHASVRNDEAFAYVPKLTVGVGDWGVFTDVKADANVWTVSTARRQYNYDCKVVQPLTLIQISFTGATANAPLGSSGSATGDDIFDQVRDPKSIL